MREADPHAPDVVATRREAEEATRTGRPPLLVLDVLRDFLDAQGIGSGPLEVERVGEGQSNVTYAVRRRDLLVVVRRGPRPPLPRSTHDMAREAAVQRLVGSYGLPVPRILAVCSDESLLGVPFYVMEHVAGVVITEAIPAALDPLEERRRISDLLVDLLVELHQVPVNGAEAQALGRPDGYLERQVARFAQLWPRVSERELPLVESLAGRLGRRIPTPQRSALLHGDYRLGNLMLHADGPARPAALLDWEMSTLGDPLADVGYLIATYADPAAPTSVMQLSPVTAGRGFLRRDELAERYARSTSLDLSELGWYQALALWKAAVFCEAIHTRWRRGERPQDDFGPRLTEGVPRLLDAADAALGR
ncbi:phosphotransferase family protein [Cnuibacter physcomitrellae]|uniref:phosphotransferase family protein n=1 Tax=Cnuibacter physcomitrellae TaxID=1619308 RepID=UPI002175C222|nr:phosphotransferase family protein [Cnuibacter physcomitrellae]MCS5497703.1 phosphotransferase family protein [Cnuibacter physcomitrellae]